MPAIDPDGLATTPEYDAKVIATFFDGDRLKNIPTQFKKRLVVLRRLRDAFERERVYSEPQVNELLSSFHEDFATLRREMVESGLLVRHKGEYARPD
jgi:hypothetical protein